MTFPAHVAVAGWLSRENIMGGTSRREGLYFGAEVASLREG